MFVSRSLLNHCEFLEWVEAAGFKDIVPEKMLHVTIAKNLRDLNCQELSRDEGDLIVRSSHHRFVRNFGGVVVLVFGCQKLFRRHTEFRRIGMTWEHPCYLPHISFAVDDDIDLSTVKPYRGRLYFGPERFGSEMRL